MTLEANKRLVRRFIEEVVNTGNVDGLADFVRRIASRPTARSA